MVQHPQHQAVEEWIFGFGSLVHNPGFDHSAVVKPCYIKGFRRVWHQGSTDHRGVPTAPGRTVTLERCEGSVVWGAAFRLAGDAEQRAKTWAYLEWREKQYDERAVVEVFTSSSSSQPALRALTYIATPDRTRNPNYLGPAPLEEIAHQIATARGPSGPNFEYLFRLADAMRQLSVQDEELFLLEAEVRARMRLLESGSAAAAAAVQATRAVAETQGCGDGSADEQQSEATDVTVTCTLLQ